MLSLNNSNDKISSFCSFSRAKLYFSNKLKKFTILVPQKFQYEYCVVSYLIWFSEFQHAIKYSIFFFFDNSNKYSNNELVKICIIFLKNDVLPLSLYLGELLSSCEVPLSV